MLTGTLLFGCVFPWLGGRYWRQSRALAEAGWLRAARLEDEQRHAEERARLRERARIAQDMHDSLGHDLSLIALRAGALQVAPDLPGHHRTAAADLRAAAADATDRLHRIIGVLREDDDPVPLSPAGEGIGQLVARAAESGLPVRWETDPAAPAPEPGGIAERLLHRVVREALTNAARHAPGAPVTVTLTGDPRGSTVTVTNGPATEGGPASCGGSGLLGLRAAVTAVGGDFTAGPHGAGFRVRAYVPARQPARPVPRPPAAPFTHARRRVALGLGAAAGAGVVLVGGAFAWYAHTETSAVLGPSAYAGLRPGMSAAQVARVLPEREVRDPPTDRAPAAPPGTDCRYYRASGELLVSVDHYRLCFDAGSGRLAAKDVVPRVGRTTTERPGSHRDPRPAGRRRGDGARRCPRHPDQRRGVRGRRRGGRRPRGGRTDPRPPPRRRPARHPHAPPGRPRDGGGDRPHHPRHGRRHADHVLRTGLRGPRPDRRRDRIPAEVRRPVRTDRGCQGGGRRRGLPLPTVARHVIEDLGRGPGGGRLAREDRARERVARLSPREREVLGLVGAGLSNPEIAARLHLVEGTVKAYVSAVLDRLEVRNRVQAAIVAHEAGLVDP